MSALVEACGIGRRFPGVLALDAVDLAIGAGEVLGVVGENGAGKSTLMKILAGVDQADAGELRVDGARVDFRSSADARACGIALIHQELSLADTLTIAESLVLGRESTRFGFTNARREHTEAKRWLDVVGLDASPATRIDALTLAQRQLVEVARALSIEARVLIMDEPTACLSPVECARLFDVVRSLRDAGVAVVLISHRLAEVEALADRVVVLRDGEMVGELDGDDVRAERMVPLMVGRDLAAQETRESTRRDDVALSARDVTHETSATAATLHVNAGEIVALAGLVGSGRTELLETIFGLRPRTTGTVHVGERRVTPHSPRDAISAGMALVPEDRKATGLLLEESLTDNITLARLALRRTTDPLLAARVCPSRPRERGLADASIDSLSIRPTDARRNADTLSGGNQQKVVLARWLAMNPRVLLLDEPTRGVDVGAKAEIYALLRGLAADGLGILFISSDLEEVLALADRVLVMHDGELRGELSADDANEESILHHATGQST